ncbi:prolyl oligopeptidase [Helicosporidium sp. ATCC 50920]|nr:prolyl oligopeptidase [Helicosporidium sp. ATCC 50920]|eukprot:KDD76541.1 prolyl oligopeptidase [Helicosporidium sp. ATCC 50920]
MASAHEALDGAASFESGPPVARIEPVTRAYHNFERCDNYTWLRDESRSESEVLNYLQAEEEFFANSLNLDRLQTADIKAALVRLHGADVSEGTNPADDVLTYGAVDETSMTTIDEQDHYLFLLTSMGRETEIYVMHRDTPYATWQPLFSSQSDAIATVNEALGRAIMGVVDVEAGSITFYYISAPMLRDIARGFRYDLRHFPVIFRTSLDVSSSKTAMYGDYFVYLEEKNLQQTIVVRKFSSSDPAGYSQTHLVIDLNTRASTVDVHMSKSYVDVDLRVTTSSPGHMSKTVAYNLNTRGSVVRRQDAHPDVNISNYVEEFIEVAANDDVRIPVSLFYRRDAVPMDGSSPMLLTFNGFYGAVMARSYSPKNILLADQGFVMAVAHIRGGGDLGTTWHEQGRLLKHKTTFSDLIRCMDELVRLGYTNRNRLALDAASAGGSALTAVANMVPGAFRAGIARLPFTDILGNLLDTELVHTGWAEYGNPKNAIVYEYVQSYSPYDNIRRQDYPHLLLTTALYDSRVPYWDPAKFVAKLRAHKTDNNMLFLSTDMLSGHLTSESDPDYFDKEALFISFMFKALGLKWKNVHLDASVASPMVEAK